MVGILKTDSTPATMAAAPPVKSIRRPERPDKKQLDSSLNAEKLAADAAGKRIQEIKAILEQHRNWKVAGSPEWAMARATVDQLNVQFHDEVEKKRGLRAELERLSEQMRAEARSSKKPLGIDRIEASIDKLRDRLEHSGEPMSAKEQMNMVQQMEELSKWKKFVKECSSKIEELKASLAEQDEILNKLSSERAKQREALEAIKKKDAAAAPDVVALKEEKNSAYEKIQAHRENMKKLREEFNAKEAQFFEADREYKKRQKALAEKRHAEFMEREKRRQDRRNQMAKEEEVDEYYDKISACEKIAAELQRFTTSNAASRTEGVEETEQEEKRARQAKLESVQGFGCLLKSKKDRDDDDWFGKPKAVKKPSSSNGNKAPKSAATKLVLQHHVLLAFSEINLPPPRTLGEIADCLVKVKAKKDEFVKLQEEAKTRPKAEKASDEEKQNGGVEAEAEAEVSTSDDASESSTGEKEEHSGTADADTVGTVHALPEQTETETEKSVPELQSNDDAVSDDAVAEEIKTHEDASSAPEAASDTAEKDENRASTADDN